MCGADLEAARRERARRQATRRSLPDVTRFVRVPSVPDDLVTLACITLVVLVFPLLGIVLAGLAIHQRPLSAHAPLRRALWVLVAVGVVLMVSPGTRYGILSLLS